MTTTTTPAPTTTTEAPTTTTEAPTTTTTTEAPQGNIETFQGNHVPTSGSQAGVLLCATERFTLSEAQAQKVESDDLIIFSRCVLPKEHVLVDAKIDTDALDGATDAGVSMGLLNDDGDDFESEEIIIPETSNHQSAYCSRMKHPASTELQKRQTKNRTVALKWDTAPDTGVAAAIEITIFYRPAERQDD